MTSRATRFLAVAAFFATCLAPAATVARYEHAVGVIAPHPVTYVLANDQTAETAATPAACPPTLKVFDYVRTGGIAGFMDHLEVFESGCYARSRRGGSSTGWLRGPDKQRFLDWRARLHSFEWETSSPPGASDRMYEHLSFTGSGDEAGNREYGEMLSWLRRLLRQEL